MSRSILRYFGVAKRYSKKMNYSSKNSTELAAPEFSCLATFSSSTMEFCFGAMPNTPLVCKSFLEPH
jgi:hypothetical protein